MRTERCANSGSGGHAKAKHKLSHTADCGQECQHRPQDLLDGVSEVIQVDHGIPAAQLGEDDEWHDRTMRPRAISRPRPYS